ncbi:MAG: ABC transporter permease [Chloroflexi bacterium]|nr:ABC transporter permease [Chloroflexota bacterium]MDA1272089.1 ABC transporter permease [Chloroflexota bacterium]
MTAIFWLSIRQLTGRWRMTLILLLAALPVGLAVLVHFIADDDPEFNRNFTNILLDGMLVSGILPIVTMALTTSAFGNELEDRTLGYMTTTPVARWCIFLAKVLASVVICGPLLLASGITAALLGFDGEARPTIAVAAGLGTGLVAYSTIFTWLGLVTTRALPFALIYVLLWEGVLSTIITGINYLSVHGYALAIISGLDEPSFPALGERVIDLPVAIAGAAGVTVLFFALGVRRLRRMDVP